MVGHENPLILHHNGNSLAAPFWVLALAHRSLASLKGWLYEHILILFLHMALAPFSSGREGVLVVWQLETGKKKFLPRIGSPLLYFTDSPDPTLSSISCADNHVHILKMPSMEILKSISGIKVGFRYPFKFLEHTTTPSGMFLLSCFELMVGHKNPSILHHNGNSLAVAFSVSALAHQCLASLQRSYFDRLAHQGLALVLLRQPHSLFVLLLLSRPPSDILDKNPHLIRNRPTSSEYTVGKVKPISTYNPSFVSQWVEKNVCEEFQWACKYGVTWLQGNHYENLTAQKMECLKHDNKVHFMDPVIQPLVDKIIKLFKEQRTIMCTSDVKLPEDGIGSLVCLKKKAMTAAAFSADGSILAVAAETVITLWDLTQRPCCCTQRNSKDYLVTVSGGSQPQLSVCSMSKLSVSWSYKLQVEGKDTSSPMIICNYVLCVCDIACAVDALMFAVLVVGKSCNNETTMLKGRDGVILLFNVADPLPVATWSVRKAKGGGLGFIQGNNQTKNIFKAGQELVVYVDGDHEFVVFDPQSSETHELSLTGQQNLATIEETGQLGYASVYGELPEFELKSKDDELWEATAPSRPSERPWESIFSGSSHDLPPLTKLCPCWKGGLLLLLLPFEMFLLSCFELMVGHKNPSILHHNGNSLAVAFSVSALAHQCLASLQRSYFDRLAHQGLALVLLRQPHSLFVLLLLSRPPSDILKKKVNTLCGQIKKFNLIKSRMVGGVVLREKVVL
ncbi:hypothetical protein G4B88_020663 [Cannabis sativa]|uniref:Uncharacterized protein n=1 Tax=Cannabis sativa TaxID=3483 RepID=A0A7J6HLB6_CANSA|nr:hypothetical protein G4B88_020663 [Cannabis sativa]